MKRFISKIKHFNEDTESDETVVLCIEADTYGTAENASYKWSEDNLSGLWSIESVVKSQIKEVHKDVEDESNFFLVKYEFGLKAKPEKSNILVTDFSSCHKALVKAETHLGQFASGLFVTEIRKQDIKYFISNNEVKELLGLVEEHDFSDEELMQL